ncbi:villin-like 1 [Striga asiatica]|uniref:Villin-like 1 n=1 Tax=Striga asiatica TaxID=4170 RepID=A0A5A7Q3L3_STRAF|nr:villin-like 1 [Striga asiatica]
MVATSGRDRVRRKPQFTREQGSPEFFARWRRRWAATQGVGGERVVALLGSRRRGLATGSDRNSQVHSEDTRRREARGIRFAETARRRGSPAIGLRVARRMAKEEMTR